MANFAHFPPEISDQLAPLIILIILFLMSCTFIYFKIYVLSIGKTQNYLDLITRSTLFHSKKQRDLNPTGFDKNWFSSKMWRKKKYIVASFEVK